MPSLISTPDGRVDFVHVGTDHGLWHLWASGDVNQFSQDNESWGAPAGVQLVDCRATYSDADSNGVPTRFLVVAWDASGSLYLFEWYTSGGLPWGGNGWIPFTNTTSKLLVDSGAGPKGADGATGPAGPPGAPGLNGVSAAQLAAALETAVVALRAG